MTQPNTFFTQRALEAYVIVFLLVLLPAIWLLIGHDELSTERAHNAFLAQLNALSPASFSIEVNGNRIDEARRLVADLKRVKLYRGEHAPGGKPKWYRIEITDDQRTLRFLLARPDNVGDKYWVFLPATDSEGFSAANPSLGMRIGGFIDPQLNDFLAEHERR